MPALPPNAVPVERIYINAEPSMPCAMLHMIRYHWAMQQIIGLKVRNMRLSILDIACGSGYGTEYLAAYPGTSVMGVDCDSTTIADAGRLHGPDKIEEPDSYVTYAIADVMDYLYETNDRKYDVVVSFETLEHLDCLPDMLVELLRVTKVLLLFSVPNNEPEGSWIYHKTFGITKGSVLNLLPVEDIKVRCYGQYHQPDCKIVAYDHKERDKYSSLVFSVKRG